MKFEELPTSWATVTLEALADVSAGNPAPQGEANFAEDGLPFVRVQDMGRLQGKYLRATADRVSEKGTQKLRLMPAGTVLLTKSGASTLLNQRAILGQDSYVVSHIATISSNLATSPDWLFYWLKTVDAVTLSHGGNMPSLPLSRVKQVECPLAPLAEQQRIVEKIETLFAELDQGEEALREGQKLLARYRQSVLKAAVTGTLTANWRAANGPPKETGEDLLARILEERRATWQGRGKYKEPVEPETEGLPELPEGWTWSTMPMLGEFGRGKSKHRPRGDPKLYEDGKYPFLQTGRVRNSSGLISEYDKLYSDFGLAQSKLWPAGTVCITIAANIAESGILEIDACFPDSVVGLVPHEEIEGAYVELFIRTAKADLDRFAPATAQKNINLDTLNNVAVPLPPAEEQSEIADKVTSLIGASMVIERGLEHELDRSAALRQSILKDAFSGKLVPQDPSDEPAEKLLERIRAARAEKPKAKRKKAAA